MYGRDSRPPTVPGPAGNHFQAESISTRFSPSRQVPRCSAVPVCRL